MRTYAEQRLIKAAFAAERRTDDPTRHKCFLCYRAGDADEVTTFVEDFGDVFIPRVIGVSDDDPFVDSSDTDYVLDCIREEYLTDSTVTIVMVGRCTWARKYVDWEVYSSLRNDKNNKRSGLMAITLPSVADYDDRRLPNRVADNVDGKVGYARWWKYPKSKDGLRSHIAEAFTARSTKTDLIENSRARKLSNSNCS